jgi:hypothetical protein
MKDENKGKLFGVRLLLMGLTFVKERIGLLALSTKGLKTLHLHLRLLLG